ncbi:hypothetical protein PIROE2DRAFT_6578, partial [Piromyces sp. E2]
MCNIIYSLTKIYIYVLCFKADNYTENKFVETRGYYKLNLEFPQYTKGFHWLLKTRCGYKLDSTVLKAAKLVNSSFPDCCFCCKKDNCEQSLEHWLLNYSLFNEIRNDVINNLDIVHSCFNSDSRNVNSENSGNISGNNSSEIGLNNSSNEISNNSDSVKLFTLKLLTLKFSLSVNRSSINRSNRKCSK